MTAKCTSHCPACGCHFTSTTAFDAHRSGNFKDERYCLAPEEVEELTCKDEDALCDIGRYDERGELWQLEAAAQLAEYFRKRKEENK